VNSESIVKPHFVGIVTVTIITGALSLYKTVFAKKTQSSELMLLSSKKDYYEMLATS
jgi:hypothetical protein